MEFFQALVRFPGISETLNKTAVRLSRIQRLSKASRKIVKETYEIPKNPKKNVLEVSDKPKGHKKW